MNINRDAASIVRYSHRFVTVNSDGYSLTVTGQRFVDGIIDNFEHHVVEARAIIGITYVHSRALANRV
jgi:hypothetical protein